MPRPAWTEEQKLAAKQRIAAKKLTAQPGAQPATASPAEPGGGNDNHSPTPAASHTHTADHTAAPAPAFAPFNRVMRNGHELARVVIKPLTESLTGSEVPEPAHERLSGLVHVNTAIPKPRDANRLKEIAWTRYQIACQIKALGKVNDELEAEGRELLITYDCGADPLRFDFLKIKLGRGGGGERIDRKKLEAAGVALDTIHECSNPVKTWERMQVSDGTEKEYSGE